MLVHNFNVFILGRYPHEMGYSENYNHYEPPFQTVPSSIPPGSHWPTDIGGHQQHTGYANLNRENHAQLNNPLQNHMMADMHSPVSLHGQDSKPVIQAAVLAGYSGTVLKC